ncbi:ABC transporter permease [Amycolatopsis sp. GM8]|uniref:ABC transporter permease n=1 Tax=Amycolatopsis sp. GM8 TaxID=2896530 RepID=UPI001F17EE65|nr:ABC transporter permease [Amycolatopsis sp. GM8]
MTTSSTDAPPTKSPPAPATGRRRSAASPALLLERFGLLLLFVVLIVVFTAARPDTFATAANFRSIAISQSVLAVAALALMLPLVGGRFDVSVGANLGLCSIVTATLMSKAGLPLPLAVLGAIVVGSLVGAINGAVVAYLGVNSIIATLGAGTVIGGLVTAYTKGVPISSGLSPILATISTQLVAGLPVLFVIMLVLALATWFMLTQTPFGRHLTAVGSNAAAARLTGLRVNRLVLLSFVGSGLLAGIAGVLQVGAQGNGDPTIGGLPFILPALAAVFLGATTWHPGTYNVQGTILGLFFLGTTISGLTLLGVQPWVTDVFNGGAVVLAIIFSAQLKRRRTGFLDIGS